MNQAKNRRFRTTLLLFIAICHLPFAICGLSAQQSEELQINLDLNAATTPLPKIFQPNMDLSGRGYYRQASWPQSLAAPEVLERWEKDIGFGYIYRLQYNLWEISQLAKDKEAQDKLLNNYEEIIKKISDSGGIVILDIFSTPPGFGQALDKKSPPWNFKVFKELIKAHMRNLSCDKGYNIWYEVWTAPDLDDFFLGSKQEYLNLYRAVAESARELGQENKLYIPVGGPGASWWFQNLDLNTITTPEKSLIYELIKFCCRYRLPLDFVSWHAYTTDPKAEKENTAYKKKIPPTLIRDWLAYFRFDKNTPLIIDEWNYDTSANMLPERQEKAFVAASYIPARIRDMQEAGITHQVYYCLEDFENNKENVVRNVGVFSFDPESSGYKGAPKASYNVFRMLSMLGKSMFGLKLQDEFVGAIATGKKDKIAILVYNYIDPEIGRNSLSRNVVGLSGAERKILLVLINSGKLDKIITGQIEPSSLRTTKRLQNALTKARELKGRAVKFQSEARKINLGIKNIQGSYLYQRYAVDSSCSANCAFKPVEEKELSGLPGSYQEALAMNPYSVYLIVLTKKAEEPQPAGASPVQEPQAAGQTAEPQDNPQEKPGSQEKN